MPVSVDSKIFGAHVRRKASRFGRNLMKAELSVVFISMKKIDSTIVNGSAQPAKKVVMAKMIASARASSHQSTRHCCFFSGGSGGLAGSSFSPSSQPLTNLRFHEASGGVYRRLILSDGCASATLAFTSPDQPLHSKTTCSAHLVAWNCVFCLWA